jgi:hypothetical protein
MGATSLLKGILWILSAILSLFIAAMTVSPQEAVANVMRWLTLFGLRGASNWFSMHATHKVHLSPDSVMHAMTTKCTGPSCAHAVSGSGSSVDVPDVVLIALTALLTALVLIWFMRRRPTSLLSGMERRGF